MGSLWRCDCLAAVLLLESGGVEGEAGSSIRPTLSIAGMLLGIGEGVMESMDDDATRSH